MDHPDFFSDIAAMRAAYARFLDNVVPGGMVVACTDSPQVRRLLAERGSAAPVRSYGRGDDAAYRVDHIVPNARGGVDLAVFAGNAPWASCSLGLPGAHNALNATAALIVADACGVPPVVAGAALADYRGVRRRFELKGEAGGVTVVDDYGHHPTEIAATMAAARLRYPGRRLWAVVQPHTYSRLQALWDGFRTCLVDADEVIITNVYAARSREVPTASDAAHLVAALDHPSARHIGALGDVQAYLLDHLRPGDVVITLGAGDGNLVGEGVLAALRERQP
jgi:UDP-N-acetylmuramate--alanine ligase